MGDALWTDRVELDTVRTKFPVLAQRIHGAELA